jgi:hypothetical protein
MDGKKIFRKITLALAVLLALAQVAPAQTAQTRAQLQTLNNATIYPNGQGQITAAKLNILHGDEIASFATLADPNVFLQMPTFPCTGLMQGNGTGPVTCGATTLTASTLSALTPVIHEGQGGIVTVLGNFTNYSDFLQILSGDQSLYTAAVVTGTATVGENPGLSWTVPGFAIYVTTVAATAGESNQNLALAICNAAANNGSLVFAMANYKGADGLGYAPFETGCANQTANGEIVFDAPYGVTVTAISTIHTSVNIVSALTGSGPPKMDGGPVMQIQRFYPVGYALSAGDQGPYLNFQIGTGNPANPASNTQIGYIQAIATSAASFEMNFGVLGDAGIGNRLVIHNGVYVPGTGCPGDEGATTLSACGMVAGEFILGGAGALPTPGSLIANSSTGQMEMSNLSTGFIFRNSANTSTLYSETDAGAFSIVTGVFGIPQATWTDTQTCTAGQISVDASDIYVCTATNTVKRAALSTF